MSTEFIKPLDPMRAPERFMPLRVTPLMPQFGAMIDGIDLSVNLAEDVKLKLREAYLRFGLLFFRGQKRLTQEQQVSLTKVFGDPDGGSPFFEKEDGKHVNIIRIDENNPPVTNVWHSDNSGLPDSSMGTLIQIQQCPQVGGNTSWSCTRNAYDCLSDPMKRYLEDFVAIHYWDKRGNWDGAFPSTDKAFLEKYFGWIEKYPPQEHPVVLEHPIAKTKAIYVNPTFTGCVRGVHRYESESILNFLYSWVRMPEFCYTHHWQENDIGVWDNYSTQHYALADFRATRINQRVEFVAGKSLNYGL